MNHAKFTIRAILHTLALHVFRPAWERLPTRKIRTANAEGQAEMRLSAVICTANIAEVQSGTPSRKRAEGNSGAVGWPGLEPGTNALKGHCSTN